MSTGETPAERLARWTATDLAIGIAAQGEQLRSQLAERVAEIDDLRARLAQLTTRVAQLEAENAELRRRAGRVPMTSLLKRVYRKLRSAAAARRRQ
jgi:regulator of replication initiation timing